jgi:hypothetical protein
MATGYTYPVANGEITEFKDFAMSCARAFGALITMRDEPQDAPIPEEFKPGDFHEKRLADAKDRLARLNVMTIDEAEASATGAFNEAMKSHQEYEAKEAEAERRLNSMIKKVEAWTPPTANHTEMKKFMIDQLVMSRRGSYRSPEPVRLSGKDWLSTELEKAQHNVGYHAAEHAKEVERTASRAEWVKQLRRSLSV